MKYSLQCHM